MDIQICIYRLKMYEKFVSVIIFPLNKSKTYIKHAYIITYLYKVCKNIDIISSFLGKYMNHYMIFLDLSNTSSYIIAY